MPYKQFSENTITCSPPTSTTGTSCFTKNRYKNSSLINKTNMENRGYRRFSPGLRVQNQICSEKVSKEYAHGALFNNNFLYKTSEPNMALSNDQATNIDDTKTSSFNLAATPYSNINLNVTATRQLLP